MFRRFLDNRVSIYWLAAVVGVVAGAGAVAFEYLSGLIVWAALGHGAGYLPATPTGEVHLFVHYTALELSLLGLMLMPALGGLLSGALCATFAPEASGHGTDSAIEAYHQKGGYIRGRVPIIKALATALSLGTGGSGGREGPIAQIGAGFGSFLGQVLGLKERQQRILLAAGMGAGVGAIFRAPLAGALFSSEILYREADLEAETVMPSFISSAVAYCVFCGWMGEFGTLFHLGAGFEFHNISEMVPYTGLALVLLPVIVLYVKVFYGTEKLFHRSPLPRPLGAAIGGLLTGALGILALWLTDDELALSVMSYGYGVLQETLDGDVTGWSGFRLLLLVALLKVFTTSLTISSGGSGGVFGPSMVIGGGIGGAVGIACQQWGLVENPASFVLVGMCGFFAGAAKTPISTIIMVTEMTGSYKLLVPAMWVCGLTFLLSSRWTIYIKQVPHRALSPAHRGEYQVALLEKMKVKDVYQPGEILTVPIHTPLSEVVRIIANSHEDYFPVVDDQGRFVGIFSAHDVREHTFDPTIHHLAIAGDIMTSPPITVTPEDDLHTAMEKFNIKKLDELPIVDAEDPHKLIGRLYRRDIGRAYTQRLRELKELQQRS